MSKIIFLDIDGVMIPAITHLQHQHASMRQILDPRAVWVLKEILNKSGAKIVFNTTHNYDLFADSDWPAGALSTPGLIARFEAVGIGNDYIHTKMCTQYPNPDPHPNKELSRRLVSIYQWLTAHGQGVTKWIALDDEKIDHENAILINPFDGLGYEAYNAASEILGFESRWVMI